MSDDPKTTVRGLASEAVRHAATTLLKYQEDAMAVFIVEAFKGEGDKIGISCIALERQGVDPKKWVKAVYDEVRAMAVMAGVVEDTVPVPPGRIITLN